VTFMPGKFYPHPLNFHQSDLGRRADSRWALPQISSLFCDRTTVTIFTTAATIITIDTATNTTNTITCTTPAAAANIYVLLLTGGGG